MDGTETAVSTMTDMITSALETLMSVATTLVDYALENPVLAILFVGGTIVPAGFALFRNAKGSVQG